MILHPPKFDVALRAALPVPQASDAAIDLALRRLVEIIDRDPSTRAIVEARRGRRGHAGTRSAGYR